MRSYRELKEQARQKAIDWQIEAGEKCMSYYELMQAGAEFEKLGKRYGLLNEFRQNGIC